MLGLHQGESCTQMGESIGLSQVWKTEISELGLLLTLCSVG